MDGTTYLSILLCDLVGQLASLDKAPRPSISNVYWISSSDTICQLSQLFSNSEGAMLSMLVLPSGGAMRSTSSGLARPTPTKRASGDGRPPRGDFETASRWPSFQGLDLFNGTQVAWHDFSALNFWLDKSWYSCLKELCLRGVDHKIFSELARQ